MSEHEEGSTRRRAPVVQADVESVWRQHAQPREAGRRVAPRSRVAGGPQPHRIAASASATECGAHAFDIDEAHGKPQGSGLTAAERSGADSRSAFGAMLKCERAKSC